MSESFFGRKSAVYLVGHGPYREPRPIELQMVRIQRYLAALSTKLDEVFHVLETFIDLNWPRADWWGPRSLPNFQNLRNEIQQNKFEVVFIDIAPGDPRSYNLVNSIPSLLRVSGVRVMNAYFDDEGALADEIVRRFGSPERSFYSRLPSDSSDIVAFFPKLASSIAFEAMAEDETQGSPELVSSSVRQRLEKLGEESPYVGGQFPFLNPRLERKLLRERHKREEEDRAARRKSGEFMFQIRMDSPPLLCDEGIWGGQSRKEDQFKWAEVRLINDLGFRRSVSGVVISYQRELEGFLILADPRQLGALTFYLYRPLRQTTENSARRNRAFKEFGQFRLLDTWKRDLYKKFERLAFEQIGIEINPAICRGVPCIGKTQIPIWVLERDRQLGFSDGDLLRRHPGLRVGDLANAWVFVRAHRAQIEEQIRENEVV